MSKITPCKECYEYRRYIQKQTNHMTQIADMISGEDFKTILEKEQDALQSICKRGERWL